MTDRQRYITVLSIGFLFIFVASIMSLVLIDEPTATWEPTDSSEKCYVRTLDDIRTVYCVMDLK
jgi:hypothetical protein